MAVPPPFPDPAPVPDPAKAALRGALRAGRQRFVAELGVDGLAAALDALHRHLAPVLGRGGPLAGYLAHRGEPDVRPFLADACRWGVRVALPHVAEDRTMSFADWHPDAALTTGPFGITQPVAAGRVEPAVLLMPLVGFDRRGVRLGQGGGFYDRWLAAHPAALRIGVAWSVQERNDLPADPWDMPLHAIVTEREWIASLGVPA